jgi:hypothetical protein
MLFTYWSNALHYAAFYASIWLFLLKPPIIALSAASVLELSPDLFITCSSTLFVLRFIFQHLRDPQAMPLADWRFNTNFEQREANDVNIIEEARPSFSYSHLLTLKSLKDNFFFRCCCYFFHCCPTGKLIFTWSRVNPNGGSVKSHNGKKSPSSL